MRPSGEEPEQELYECFECGQRPEDVDARVCDSCGGPLRNVSRPRDL